MCRGDSFRTTAAAAMCVRRVEGEDVLVGTVNSNQRHSSPIRKSRSQRNTNSHLITCHKYCKPTSVKQNRTKDSTGTNTDRLISEFDVGFPFP